MHYGMQSNNTMREDFKNELQHFACSMYNAVGNAVSIGNESGDWDKNRFDFSAIILKYCNEDMDNSLQEISSLLLHPSLSQGHLNAFCANQTKPVNLEYVYQRHLADVLVSLLEQPDVRLQRIVGFTICRLYLNISCTKMQLTTESLMLYIECSTLAGLAKYIIQRKCLNRPTNIGEKSSIPLDDTTGWGYSESYFFTILLLILSSLNLSRGNPDHMFSKPLSTYLLQEEAMVSISDKYHTIMDLVIAFASSHASRYIREMSLWFIAQMCCTVDNVKAISELPQNTLSVASQLFQVSTATSIVQNLHYFLHSTPLFPLLLDAVAKGLEDDWSQIRFAATWACRSLLTLLADDGDAATASLLSRCWPQLLPRLCMNRFYAAEAVKGSSLDFWKQFFSPSRFNGKALLSGMGREAVDYYIRCSSGSTNHMVCEAACHAMVIYSQATQSLLLLPSDGGEG